MDTKLQGLDATPGQVTRVDNAEVQLGELKRELEEIKQNLGSQDLATSNDNSVLLDKVLCLEQKNDELSARLARVSTSKPATTTVYCSLVFCNISDEQVLLLQRVLNRGIKYIFGVRKSDHVTPFRRKLGWLRAKGRRDCFATTLLNKIINSGVPPYLANFIVEKHCLRLQGGVNPDELLVPSSNHTFLLLREKLNLVPATISATRMISTVIILIILVRYSLLISSVI